MNSMNQALTAYADVDLQTAIVTASPVQIVVLLYDGAINALAAAKGRMLEKRFAEKGALISKAIGIVEGLRSVLDHSRGGDVTSNLEALYDYMKRRLASANLKNEVEGVEEVMRLLSTLREAWVELEQRERRAAQRPAVAETAAAGVSLRA